MRNRILSMLITTVIIFTNIPTINLSVQALDWGGFEYEIISDKDLEIIGYTSNLAPSLHLSIPNMLGSGERVVKKIGDSAFEGFTNLEFLTFQYDIERIGAKAFENCESLKSVAFVQKTPPDFGDDVFLNCLSLTAVYVHESAVDAYKDAIGTDYAPLVKKIGDSYGTDWTLVDGILTISSDIGIADWDNRGVSAHADYYLLKEIIIGDGVTIIPYYTFADIRSAVSLTISDSVTVIERNSFSGCISLETVIIGEGVTQIGPNAFSNCRNLISVTFKSKTPPVFDGSILEARSFFGVRGHTVYVPEGSKSAYISRGHQLFPHHVSPAPYKIIEYDSDGNYIDVPVTNITGIPAIYIIEEGALTLNVSIAPNDATYKDIIWSVHEAGTTGAAIDGNVFTATSEGTATIRATIINEKKMEIYYTQDFGISVRAFVPITNITLTASDLSGHMFALYPQFEPSNATNQTVQWSVINAGITGVKRDFQNWFSIYETWGKFKIRVTVRNGIALGEDYTKDFTITAGKCACIICIGDCVVCGCECNKACGDCGTCKVCDATYSAGNGWTYNAGTITVSTNDSTTNWRKEIIAPLQISDLINGVVIANTVTEIGVDAFRGCEKIESITISDSVLNIGNNAFMFCNSIKSVTFMSSEPPTFGNYVFSSGSSYALTTIYVPVGSKALYEVVEMLNQYDILEDCFGSGCGECYVCLPKCSECGERPCVCVYCDVCGELEEDCTCVYCEICTELEADCTCVYCEICTELEADCTCVYCEVCGKLENDCTCVYCEVCGELEDDCLGHDHLYIGEINIVDGYIKLHNPTGNAISCKGLYLTNTDEGLFKWQMPSVIIRPGEYVEIITSSSNRNIRLKRMKINFDLNYGGTLLLTDAKGEVISEVDID